jgi:uncharacterized protein (TIGR00725 family)
MKNGLIVGVMGGGQASAPDIQAAYELGALIAVQGWILLNGGRNAGIMDASAKGARDQGGITVGILPDDSIHRVSEHIKIPIVTGMGDARNNINVLTSNIVVACPGGAGTISEIALALKNEKQVILFNFDTGAVFEGYRSKGLLFEAETPEKVIETIQRLTG